MKMRPRTVLLLPLTLLWLGQSSQAPGVKSPTSQEDADTLATLVRSNAFREADRLAARILAAPRTDARTMAVCGLAILKAGRVEEAEALFRKVVAREPESPEAHLGLGRVARIRNDADAAVSHLRLAVSSEAFFEDALRQLWRAAWDRGLVDDLLDIHGLAESRYGRESKPLPSWFTNGLAQVQGLEGKRLYEMTGAFERLRVPLIAAEPHSRIRMIALKLNGKGDYLFDIDSASADFLTVSPLLAEELGLVQSGGSSATGVGTAAAAVRFAVLDKVELGPVVFRNVPVMVSDIQPFRGLKKGLLGTAFLKRFNATIDVEREAMELVPLDRPELLASAVDRSAVAADVPLLLYDATMVEASVEGAPPALYILDSAAATHLVDGPFFAEHVRPKTDPARIVEAGIQGAQGAQRVLQVNGVTVRLGTLALEGQQINEFPMERLNVIPGRYSAGLLGNPVLWPYRVHLDFKNGRLVLEKRRRP